MSEDTKLSIRVHEFYQQSDPVKDEFGKDTGEIVVRDYVKYGPPHLMDKFATVARVERLSRVREPQPNETNVHLRAAWDRWKYIEPLYEAWKRGEELPEDGIPLAACTFLRKEDVAILKRNGIKSVQELATITDAVADRVPLPSMKNKRTQARHFMDAQNANKVAAEMARRDNKIEELERMVADLAKRQAAPVSADEPEVDENGDRIPRRRGRPPKAREDDIQDHEAA